MNISSIYNSNYNNANNVTGTQMNTISTDSKTQNVQKPDAISSATKNNGGDHYFEARV